MTRVQLRSFYDAETLAQVYDHTYDHRQWQDHIMRVAYTAEILAAMHPTSVADLSCGDGAIVRQAGLADVAFLGDIVPGYGFTGPIETTIADLERVDVFLLSETLEHVEDPDGLLRAIRAKADRLLLSTPTDECDAGNPEHYWAWGTDDLDEMLDAAGWLDRSYTLYTPVPGWYTFQIWKCS